jgi:hypothetical protein
MDPRAVNSIGNYFLRTCIPCGSMEYSKPYDHCVTKCRHCSSITAVYRSVQYCTVCIACGPSRFACFRLRHMVESSVKKHDKMIHKQRHMLVHMRASATRCSTDMHYLPLHKLIPPILRLHDSHSAIPLEGASSYERANMPNISSKAIWGEFWGPMESLRQIEVASHARHEHQMQLKAASCVQLSLVS